MSVCDDYGSYSQVDRGKVASKLFERALLTHLGNTDFLDQLPPEFDFVQSLGEKSQNVFKFMDPDLWTSKGECMVTDVSIHSSAGISPDSFE